MWYLGPQRRWVLLAQTTGFLLAAYSLARFSLSSTWLLVFVVPLVLNVITSVVSLSSSQRRRRVDLVDHTSTVTDWRPERYPSVDFFLPTCGEAIEVLENVYAHVAAVVWEGPVTVYVLDDGARPEVRQAAARHGFNYVVRPNRGELKKAGNMRHAFNVSSGDLVAVLDADFCPRVDYLYHLVPYFDDAGVGIVQSPQVFDTDTSMNWLQRAAGATQELFYRWIQPSRDRAGAPICVGTNAVYRRAALVDAGGFAAIEHSEDVHTGVNMLKVGYATQYVPIQVAKGVCPDSLRAFINQQYRWCTGSMSLLGSKEFHRSPLTLRQRLCFWAGFLYYITTAVNVFTMFLPAIVMAFFFPEDVRASHYIPFTIPMWLWLVLMPYQMKNRWRYEVLRVQVVYSFCHAVAIADMLLGRTAGWVPTGSVGGSDGLARRVAQVAVVSTGLILAGGYGGLLYGALTQGWAEFWPMAMFLVAKTYLGVPLIRDLMAECRPFGRTVVGGGSARSTARVDGPVIDIVLSREQPPAQPAEIRLGVLTALTSPSIRERSAHSLSRIEAVTITAALALGISLAAGWFDLMLAWGW
ncbi:MAG: glycosyltransferase family 2 protein [Kineosporiaceae bacterium]